jgi:hypothetical protein
MKQQTLWALFLSVIVMLANLLPAVASNKKPTGKISDLAAFSKIHSYCVDSSDLPGDEALDLKRFVSNENRPKGLLSKLPWILVSDCEHGSPDVSLRMEFQKFAPVRGNAPAEGEAYTIRAYLRLSQDSSSSALYEVEAVPTNNSMGAMSDAPMNDPLANQRYDAVYTAFWMLVEDVKRVSQTNSK